MRSWARRQHEHRRYCEALSLRRGRGLHHVRKVGIGTQEARPGPTEFSLSGALYKGEPECRAELRSGVGSTHSTDEAAEGNEVVEGRGRLEGMPSERGRSPDAEPGRSKKNSSLAWVGEFLPSLTFEKSPVRESRTPGSVRAKLNGLATRPRIAEGR